MYIYNIRMYIIYICIYIYTYVYMYITLYNTHIYIYIHVYTCWFMLVFLSFFVKSAHCPMWIGLIGAGQFQVDSAFAEPSSGTGDKNEGLAMLIRRSAFRDIEALGHWEVGKAWQGWWFMAIHPGNWLESRDIERSLWKYVTIPLASGNQTWQWKIHCL